tara:strand:- start:2767 stop:4344 length:1578 start_codon:yes stop_codon:yes gene_type:complete
MDVLILASGKSSRLSKYTHDYFPKFMLNLNKYCFIFYILKYWLKYSKRLFLVINSKFNKITNQYINNFFNENDNIYIINYDSYDGTAYTINNILNNELNNYDIKNLLISWCDIYPIENINFDKINNNDNNNNIFIFTHGDSCRYIYDNNKIKENENGNIVGIYYFQNFKNFNLDKDCYGKDIVEYLDKIGKIYEIKILKLIDYGDTNKYNKLLNIDNNDKFICRSFNEMIQNENTLIKKSINEIGNKIMNFERNFYKFINNINISNNLFLFPKIYKLYQNGYSMEYLNNYIPVYKVLYKNDKKYNELIIDKILYKLNILHNLKTEKISKISFLGDLNIEIYSKIKDRINNIKDIIDHFPKFKKVNGLLIKNFDEVLEKCRKDLFYYYESLDIFEYSIIHGDTNFSNILIDSNDHNNIIFIDPRGYFGKSEILGLHDYDYSKVLYAIYGYDKFNNEHFNIESLNEEEIIFEIPKINISKEFINKKFSKVHHIFVVIIWLGLAEYNKNNIVKCIISYYYGLYLGTLI